MPAANSFATFFCNAGWSVRSRSTWSRATCCSSSTASPTARPGGCEPARCRQLPQRITRRCGRQSTLSVPAARPASSALNKKPSSFSILCFVEPKDEAHEGRGKAFWLFRSKNQCPSCSQRCVAIPIASHHVNINQNMFTTCKRRTPDHETDPLSMCCAVMESRNQRDGSAGGTRQRLFISLVWRGRGTTLTRSACQHAR